MNRDFGRPTRRLLLPAAAAVPILLALLSPVPAPAKPTIPEPVPVARVDLTRYAGLWYEVAKIPNRFQKSCATGTTATYTLLEDGRIEVVNRCRKRDGSEVRATGVAEVVDGVSNAKLRVSFVSFLGIRPFWGDYWILALGDDYEFALVGAPDRKYGWILSRTPTLPPSTVHRVLDAIRAQGYDPDRFQASPQDSLSVPN